MREKWHKDDVFDSDDLYLWIFERELKFVVSRKVDLKLNL